MDPVLIPTWIATILMGYSTTIADFRYNAKYTFVIDKDSSIVVMNSQTGHMWRCDSNLKICSEPMKTIDSLQQKP
jgi:hypothetical protein